MINRFLIIILLNVFTLSVFSINKDSLSKKKNEPTPLEFLFKPQLSIGVGMMTFYGDIGSNHSGYHPTVSRLGYDLRLINPLTDYLDVSFYVMFGQVSSNERTVNRNLNFNSNITTGGITLNYNFRHLLKRERIINPYVHLGIESVEFLSKTDLRDVNGNYYNYWSDGTIRDIAQNDANANSAVEIYRDYSYESDIREENIDGLMKYKFLKQNKNGMPLSLLGMASVAFTPKEDVLDYYSNVAHRFSYYNQIIISSKLNYWLSGLLNVSHFYRNLIVQSADLSLPRDVNGIFGIGLGIRTKLTRKLSLVGEYSYSFNELRNSEYQYSHPLSLGVEIETGGHVFHINLSNSAGLIGQDLINKGPDNWLDGEFKLGFTISRVFAI